ncbi:MAG: phosphatidylserine decarboxylase [Phycisphaerales bacterium]|nr:phosphatidylserine decarboxylase [Phycisphaerales bacterium]
MRLAPEGLREWGSATIVTALAIAPLWVWCPVIWLNWVVTGVVGALWVFVVQFFRDPTRHPPKTIRPGDFLSPADGVVSAVLRVDSHEAVEGRALIIRVFLNVFNVHVNRVPCDGQVLDTTHREGLYLDARKSESAMVNESMLIRMRRQDDLPVGVRQVAGAVARRIVCPFDGGETVTRGHRMGMIKFGSTTELILPEGEQVEVSVEVGDAVTGGRTILAHVPLQSP